MRRPEATLRLDVLAWMIKTRGLSLEARAILIDLLGHYEYIGRLPVEERELARVCGLPTVRKLRRAWPEIAELFERDGDRYRLSPRGLELRAATPRRGIPSAVRRAVMERDEFTCQECGATDDLALDHIYPLSLGGEDTEDNLRVLCRPCNSRKGARPPVGAE